MLYALWSILSASAIKFIFHDFQSLSFIFFLRNRIKIDLPFFISLAYVSNLRNFGHKIKSTKKVVKRNGFFSIFFCIWIWWNVPILIHIHLITYEILTTSSNDISLIRYIYMFFSWVLLSQKSIVFYVEWRTISNKHLLIYAVRFDWMCYCYQFKMENLTL